MGFGSRFFFIKFGVAESGTDEKRTVQIMLIHTETKLRDFGFWAGGSDTANCLTWEQLDTIEEILKDIYPNGIDETALNDLMWFEEDLIAEWLGYADFEELRNDGVPWREEEEKECA